MSSPAAKSVLNPNAPEFHPRRGKGRGHQTPPRKVWRGYREPESAPVNARLVDRGPKSAKRQPLMPVTPEAERTTVMIRNIPCNYTREMLIEYLDNHCMEENKRLRAETSQAAEEGIITAFDFLYLPLDFRNGKNLGYAFVNFTEPRAVWKFYVASDDQKWEHFHSKKIRKIALAKLQGKQQLVNRFRTSMFPCGFEACLPVTFSPPRDGSNGEQVRQNLVGLRRSAAEQRRGAHPRP